MNESLSRKAFDKSPFLALKVTNYFEIYDLHLKPYFGKAVTVVEIGVLHGGSLFMWRELFGPKARIIGIDLNPNATKWKDFGFEIHIGNQEKPEFWNDFFSKVGNVDVVIDDGAHTNRAQLVTFFNVIPRLNNNGLLLIEDIHTNYEKDFGNPSRSTIINLGKKLASTLTTYGGHNVTTNLVTNSIESVSFHSSVVVFRINRLSRVGSKSIVNSGIKDFARDFRHIGGSGILKLDNRINTRLTLNQNFVKRVLLSMYSNFRFILIKFDNFLLLIWIKKQLRN